MRGVGVVAFPFVKFIVGKKYQSWSYFLQTFDYAVIGAGSAGCVLANRLSEDPKVSVCLMEAGGEDRSFWLHLPIGYGKTMWDERVNWKFQTDPDPHMNKRQIYWPRGKTLGVRALSMD